MAFDPSLSPALQGLLSRHSVGLRWMAEPGPTVEQLRQALRAALRAPDHRRLLPWRAVLIDAQQRDALADRFEAFARAVGKPDEEVAAERERAYNGPVLVAWIVRLTDEAPEVPRHEQWMSAGGALTNFLTALHLMGFGAKTLAGRKCTHPSRARRLLRRGRAARRLHLHRHAHAGTAAARRRRPGRRAVALERALIAAA